MFRPNMGPAECAVKSKHHEQPSHAGMPDTFSQTCKHIKGSLERHPDSTKNEVYNLRFPDLYSYQVTCPLHGGLASTTWRQLAAN